MTDPLDDVCRLGLVTPVSSETQVETESFFLTIVFDELGDEWQWQAISNSVNLLGTEASINYFQSQVCILKSAFKLLILLCRMTHPFALSICLLGEFRSQN